MPMVLPVPILPELGHSCSCRNRRTITSFHIEGNSSLSLTNLANKCCCFLCNVYACNRGPTQCHVLSMWKWCSKPHQIELLPATPIRPSIAFSFSLLDWLEALLLKCQVALHDATDRKKAAGSSVHGPLNAGIVFDDQSQVNTFIDNYKPKKDATEKVWFQLPCYQG